MNKKRFSICLNEILDSALREMGEKTNLSLNALINIAIREHVEKWNRDRKRDNQSTKGK